MLCSPLFFLNKKFFSGKKYLEYVRWHIFHKRGFIKKKKNFVRVFINCIYLFLELIESNLYIEKK